MIMEFSVLVSRTALKMSALKTSKSDYNLKLVHRRFLYFIAQKIATLQILTYLNPTLHLYVCIVLLSLLEKRIVNRSFSFRNPKESWISSFVMIVEISTEHRALNHIPFIYLIFLDGVGRTIRAQKP